MTCPPRSNSVCTRVLRVCAATTLLFLGIPHVAHADQGALKFFKNYFVTGDVVVAGVGLRGQGGTLDPVTGQKMATGSISISVDPSTDILAAFLYWQTMESTATTSISARGYFNNELILGKQIAPVNASACWSSGGGGGTTQGASFLKSYRANVLHLLPQQVVDGKPTGRRLANGSFPIKLADSGNGGSQSPSSGNQANLVQGASLVVVYRDPDMPLRAIVIYDGGRTLNQDVPSFSQTMKGYFQASAAGARATLTHIVADGDTNFGEALTVEGSSGEAPTVATNPFGGALGFSWDVKTYSVPLLANATEELAPIKTTVQATSSSVDCLSWTALIAGVDVKDSDYDGLLDRWESETGLTDPDGLELPDIKAMGANPNVQDIFVEIGYMTTPTAPNGSLLSTGGYTTTLGAVPPHTHLPSRAVLEAAAQVFHNAKLAGPRRFNVSGPINLHFDVGNRYPRPAGVTDATCASASTWTPPCAIIPGSLAKGGEAIDETAITSPSFPTFKGLVSWKTKFNALRDQPLSGGSTEKDCEANPNCVRRFDENRMGIFKYALIGHVLGVPSLSNPQIPRSTSGVADGGDGGGDLAVTLGLWDGATGTEFAQVSTLVHELGHTLGLRHGGAAATAANPSPNCKPNYQSVMNYFFQVRGFLITPATPTTAVRLTVNGVPQGPVLDFSRQVLNPLFEKNLTETAITDAASNPMLHPTRWYAPATNFFAEHIGMSPATRYCDGTPAPETMVRIDGTTTGAIDWNFSGTFGDLTTKTQDVNFNGTNNGTTADGELLTGFNDFAGMDLRQTASRRNMNGLSLELEFEDTGVFDWGVFDWGTTAAFGAGTADNVGDWGVFDWGVFDWGVFDWGTAEGVLDWGGPLTDDTRGDIDFLNAKSHGNVPTDLFATPTKNSIILEWKPPTAGTPTTYKVWRAAGETPMSPANLPLEIATIQMGTNTPLTYTDTTAKPNSVYWYFVTAFVDGRQSGPSNIIQASIKP